ncbi:MAG: ribosome-associated translation inhibitor RaiA [Saprospiraceae bacterium]
MKINLEYDGIGTSPDLVEYVEKKVNKLERYFDRIVQADVILKHDSGKTTKQNSCDIRLNVPNTTLFADASAATIREAVTEAADNVERQLRRYKDKLQAH